ncbi:MAG: CRTAC1 family protein, partial [Bacteroidota bacterium]
MKPTFTLLVACFLFNFSLAQSFEDYAEKLQFNQPGHNVGMAIGDFDGNGLEDIYISRKGSKNLLYVNRGDFRFEEVSQQYGLDFIGNTTCSLWFDMDNDGDQDLFLGNQFGPNRLFRNDKNTFTDVSFQYGIAQTVGNVHSVNAMDFDNDGDLDLYIAQSMQQNILWRNENGTRFVNYTQAAGIHDEGPSMGAVFFDYDNDGDVDLYQTRDNEAGNLFYRNDGGYFTDISEKSHTNYAGHGMGVDVADLNEDGLLDFYLTNLYKNVLFIQNADHSFEEHLIEGLDDNGMGWGTAIFDTNNNGLRDIYLANESNYGAANIHQSNKLFINQGDLNFFNPTTNAEVQNMFSSYAVAHADFDKDGKMDFVCANAGEEGNQIFKNTSADKNYINIQLEGTKSNTQGIGARMYVFADDYFGMDVSTGGTGYATQNTSSFHFGLKDKTQIDSLHIYWPSGTVQRLQNIAINQTITINESVGLLENGPIVWTEPAFATQLDDIILYYDAAEGNGALAGFTGDVYAHTGVITNKSSTPSDWQHVQGTWGTADAKVKMKSEGDDVYSLAYNIEDFYELAAGEVVEQLAFVFRNTDGSIVGRDTDGSDIFLEIFPPTTELLVNLVSPQNNTIVYQEGDLLIDVQSNQFALIEIVDNGNVIFSDSARQAIFTINPTELGLHTLTFTIANGEDMEVIERNYFVIDNNAPQTDAPAGTRDGVNYHTDSTLVFLLTAPNKEHVFLLCPANEYQVNTDFQLHKAPDNATFWVELP